MNTTMELFQKALEVQHSAAWARDLNLTRAALSIAKRQGRLSPLVAGNIAMKLGENPEHWIAVAALEAEPESELLARLRKSANSWRKRWLSNNTNKARIIGLFYFRLECPGFATR
jgi:hypothetical protein